MGYFDINSVIEISSHSKSDAYISWNMNHVKHTFFDDFLSHLKVPPPYTWFWLGTFEGSISKYFFSSLRILGISGNPPVPDLFDNISGLLGRSLLQLPWWMYFTPFMQLLKKNQTVLKTSSIFKKIIWIQFWILERLYATTHR